MPRQKVDPTREHALKVLRRTETALSFPKLLIAESAEGAPSQKRQKAFAYQLVMGTLRYRGTLDWLLQKVCDSGIDEFTSWIRNILRMGLYQIMYLDGVPKSAAVDESVKLAKKYGHSGTAGLVNAVLRNSKREEFLNSVESLDDNCLSDIPMKYSHPAWMVELLVEDWGRETAIEILRRNNDIPPLVARVNTLRTTRDMLVRQLDADGIMAAPLPQTGEAVKIHSAQAPPSDIQAHKDGLLYFQDAASMLAVQCLDARPGQEIIDVCAGPGGKATHIAALMENKGKILALDIHDHKVGLVQDNAQRLGVSIIETRKEDATAGLEAYHGKMDRVLADVPCSGIGVIRRRLDLKWRLVPERIDECASIQARILESAAECVRTGGILLYCTCTVTQKENSGTVQDFIRRHPEFKIDPELPPHLEKYRTKQGFVQIMPGSEDMDGFFIARLRRF